MRSVGFCAVVLSALAVVGCDQPLLQKADKKDVARVPASDTRPSEPPSAWPPPAPPPSAPPPAKGGRSVEPPSPHFDGKARESQSRPDMAAPRDDERSTPRPSGATKMSAKKSAKKNGAGAPAAPSDSATQAPERPTVFWNIWAENPGVIRYRPLPHLRPDTRYVIVVHLAPAKYGGTGVVGAAAGAGLTKNIDDWIRSGDPSVTLTALVLPDPGYFEPPSTRSKELTVDLARIRKHRLGPTPRLSADPLSQLATSNDREAVYGEVAFEVRTGTRRGHGTVGLSFWGPQGFPLEEVSATFCIATDADAPTACKEVNQVAFGLGGVDSLRAAGQAAAPPDAALHFVEVGRDGAIGVFRNRAWPAGTWVTWRLRDTIAQLQGYLEGTMLKELGKAQFNATELANKGTDLYEMFFPSLHEDGRKARAAFEDFVRQHLGRAGGQSPLVDAPSIFVRMVPSGLAPAPIVPFGLVAVKLKDEPQFIGLDFRIEIPLPAQNYAPAPDCLSRWSVVIPREDGYGDAELVKAREGLKHRIAGWDAKTLYQEMAKFGEWARKDERDTAGAAVIVVSHHDNNRFFFTDQDSIASVAFRRSFARPSLAVLSGCGTGGPGALHFIRRLSELGMGAVIATNTEVDGAMAGRFVDCLATAVEQNATTPGYNVSRAYFTALTCMQKEDRERGLVGYGPRVLLYTFLGNGALRLCPPARDSQ